MAAEMKLKVSAIDILGTQDLSFDHFYATSELFDYYAERLKYYFKLKGLPKDDVKLKS